MDARRGRRSDSPFSERSAITRLLRQARERQSPQGSAETGAEVKDHPLGRNRGLTQNQVAEMAGVSRRWYGSLEAGKPGNYSLKFLTAVRHALDLTDEEWRTLLRLARGLSSNAQSDLGSPVVPSDISDSLRTFVRRQTGIAYVSDHRWDLLAHNDAAIRTFPWMVHCNNVMEWVLTSPEARSQLVNWEEEWARPIAAQLRLQAERWTKDARLHTVIRRVLADPIVAALWQDPQLPALPHPDATRPRHIRLPQRRNRTVEVSVLAMEPLGGTGLRFVALVSRDEARDRQISS
ncbi:MmyB family transcriptional regulator [Streptomyces albus]|uniref:MmyB family transcriptional regulator n=1 Tax=Streptomyces albus TaxID=1888 RepID=UPI003F1AD86A